MGIDFSDTAKAALICGVVLGILLGVGGYWCGQVSRSSLGADVRGVEFFARTQRPGWGAFGTLDGPHTPPRFVEASP